MMTVTDHGEWEIYEPEQPPPHLRAQRVLFCRRVSDGVDWYEFQRELRNSNIKMTVDASDTVQATDRDVSMLFPAGMRLLEVEADVDHETLRQKVYDGKEFQPAREPVNVGKIQLLAALREFGLDEDDLRQLAKRKTQGSDHG